MPEINYIKSGFWEEVKLDVKANHQSGSYNLFNFFSLLLFSPGFQLLFSYRIQNRIINATIIGKIFAKLLWILTTWLTSCHVSPLARIEGGINIPHATGIVISQRAIIKTGAVIYQGVTVGIKNRDADKAPVIGKNAVIYAGAKVLGDIIIGEGAVIGANSVVFEPVPDFSFAAGIPARIIDRKSDN